MFDRVACDESRDIVTACHQQETVEHDRSDIRRGTYRTSIRPVEEVVDLVITRETGLEEWPGVENRGSCLVFGPVSGTRGY